MKSNEIILVEQTLAAYCHRVDRGTADEVAELFAEDALLMPYYDGHYDVHGRDGVRAWYAFYQQKMRETVNNLRHAIDTIAIEIDGDAASSVCYLTALFTMKTDNVVYQAQGTYIDGLVRRADRWMFQTRRIEVASVTCMGEAIERMRPMGFPGAAN